MDAELFLDCRDLINRFFKSFIAENLVFVFFHLLAEFFDLFRFQNRSQRRK
jgi:hypothetical protein